jgi:hypothetical protein
VLAPIVTGCAVVIGLDEPIFDRNASSDGGPNGPDADARPDACPSADLATNAENCGRCGRSCLGKACRDSMCEPELITQGHGSILALAVDDGAVYFNSSDQWLLGRADKNGAGAAVTYLLPEGGLRYPTTGLLVDGPYVYASAYTPPGGAGARRILKAGGAPAETIDSCNTGWSLTVDATNVYWITGNCGGTPRVRKRAKEEPDAAATVTSLPEEPGNKYAFAKYAYQAIDETDIYWVNKPEIRVLSKSYEENAASRVVFEAGDVSSEGAFRAIAVADRIYAMQGGRIIAVPKGGGQPVVLADGFPTGKDTHAGLAVTEGVLYFTVPDTGLVARVSTSGGAVETIAKDQKTPVALALDAKYIYWSTSLDGAIWRAAR